MQLPDYCDRDDRHKEGHGVSNKNEERRYDRDKEIGGAFAVEAIGKDAYRHQQQGRSRESSDNPGSDSAEGKCADWRSQPHEQHRAARLTSDNSP